MAMTNQNNYNQNELLLQKIFQSVKPDEMSFKNKLENRIIREHIRPEFYHQQSEKFRFSFYRSQVAYASILILVAISLVYYFQPKPLAKIIASMNYETQELIDLTNKTQEFHAQQKIQSNHKISLLLSDHSIVRMDAGAALKLMKARTIQLEEGRIYADIAPKGNKKPFEITTPQAKVVVLGTAFEVTTEKNRTSVSVTRGKVKIEWNQQSNPRNKTLTAGQKLEIAANTNSPKYQTVTTNPPEWVKEILKVEEKTSIVKLMKEYFPSRTWDWQK